MLQGRGGCSAPTGLVKFPWPTRLCVTFGAPQPLFPLNLTNGVRSHSFITSTAGRFLGTLFQEPHLTSRLAAFQLWLRC